MYLPGLKRIDLQEEFILRRPLTIFRNLSILQSRPGPKQIEFLINRKWMGAACFKQQQLNQMPNYLPFLNFLWLSLSNDLDSVNFDFEFIVKLKKSEVSRV